MFCRSFSITCCFNNASPRSALAASCCRYPDFECEEIFVFAVNLRICKSSMHKLQHNELSVIRSFQLSFRWLGVCLVVFFSSLANLHCELRYWKCEMIVCRLRCLDNLRYLKAFSTFTIKTPFVHGDMRLQYLPSSLLYGSGYGWLRCCTKWHNTSGHIALSSAVEPSRNTPRNLWRIRGPELQIKNKSLNLDMFFIHQISIKS